VMTHHFPTVDARLTVQDFVEDELLPSGRRCFIVLKDGNPVGLVTPQEIKHVSRAEWPMTGLEALIRPWTNSARLRQTRHLRKLWR